MACLIDLEIPCREIIWFRVDFVTSCMMLYVTAMIG